MTIVSKYISVKESRSFPAATRPAFAHPIMITRWCITIHEGATKNIRRPRGCRLIWPRSSSRRRRGRGRGEHDGREIRGANASRALSSSLAPSRCTRPSPGLHLEQQVLPARCLRPAPKTSQPSGVNDVRLLVVETAPRRCNHLTRAPLARQATRRDPESA